MTNDKFLKVLREYRVISLGLTVFVMYWGYETFLFVNDNFEKMESFVVIFYSSIVALAGWVVKNWMSTKHNDS